MQVLSGPRGAKSCSQGRSPWSETVSLHKALEGRHEFQSQRQFDVAPRGLKIHYALYSRA